MIDAQDEWLARARLAEALGLVLNGQSLLELATLASNRLILIDLQAEGTEP